MITVPPTWHVSAFGGEGARIEPYAPCVYVNDSDLEFIAPEKPYVVAIVLNDTDKPLRKRGMIFPFSGLESYVHKRTWIDRLFGHKGKLAIPPKSARAVLLTKPLQRYGKLYYEVVHY